MVGVAVIAAVAAVTVPIAAIVLRPSPDDSATPTTAVADTAPEPTATTTRPSIDPGAPVERCCGEGSIDLFVVADRDFDPWTVDPTETEQRFMRDNYDQMMVFAPYFDKRLEWFPNASVYLDPIAIYANADRDDRFDDHPDWVLRDANDVPVYIDFACGGPEGCPQYLADVTNADFRADLISRIGDLVERGYTGLVLDDVNLAWRVSDRGGNDVVPIDPRTGAEMTLTDWQEAMAILVEEIRAEFPSLVISHNALWFADSPSFDNPIIDRQIAAAEYYFLERGATDRGLVAGSSKFGFRSFLELIDRVHTAGSNVVLFDKSDGTPLDQVFNLATGLLVNNGDDLVGTARDDVVAPGSFWAGFNVDLGDAVGDRYDWNGLLRRDFTGGIVLVAEPGAETTTIDLDGEYVDSFGTVFDGELTLEGGAAAVLRAR